MHACMYVKPLITLIDKARMERDPTGISVVNMRGS